MSSNVTENIENSVNQEMVSLIKETISQSEDLVAAHSTTGERTNENSAIEVDEIVTYSNDIKDTNVDSQTKEDLTCLGMVSSNKNEQIEPTSNEAHSIIAERTNDKTTIEIDELVTETEDVNVDKESKSKEPVQKFTHLPLSKIRNIMKFDDDVTAASKEAIFLVTKATELFIGDFVKDVHQFTLASKKKTISKRDVDSAIYNQDHFIFLDGALD